MVTNGLNFTLLNKNLHPISLGLYSGKFEKHFYYVQIERIFKFILNARVMICVKILNCH